MFLERVDGHPRCSILYDPSHFVLQQLDYLAFIDFYHERIRPSTSRTPSSTRPAGRASTAASSPGSTAPAASARWATGRSISAASSPSSRQYDYRRLGGAGMGVLPEASRGRRARRRGVHRRAHHPRHREGLRRFRRRRHRRGGQPPHARSGPVRHRGGRSESGRGAARLRLGMVGGGQGAFIGAVHRIAARLDDRYELVAGALSVRPRARRGAVGADLGLAPDRCYGDFDDDGAARGRARGRHRRGRDRHAQPPAPRRRQRLPRGRHPRDLRQAADRRRWREAARARRSSCERSGRLFARDPQLHRLPDGPAGARDGRGRRARRRSASCRPSTRRTGSTTDSRRPARSRPTGAPTPRARAPAAARRHRHPRLQPRRVRHRAGTARVGCRSHDLRRRAAGSTTTRTCCCASPAARAACSGQPGRARQRERPAPARLWRARPASTGRRSSRTTCGSRRSAKRRGSSPRRPRRRRRGARMPPASRPATRKAIWKASPSSTATWPSRSGRAGRGRAARPGALLVPTVEDGARGVKFIEAVVESSRADRTLGERARSPVAASSEWRRLGIDIGWSEGQALLLDDAHCVRRHRSTPLAPCGRNGIPAQLVQPPTLAALADLCAAQPKAYAAVRGIGLSEDRCMARRCSTPATGCCVRRSLSLGTFCVSFVADARSRPRLRICRDAFCRSFRPGTPGGPAGDDDHRFRRLTLASF